MQNKYLSYFSIVVLVSTMMSCSMSYQADKFYNLRNYDRAIEEYTELLNKKENNVAYNYKLGISHLYASDDKSEAVKYLEKANQLSNHYQDVQFYLGRAYHYQYKFDKAIQHYENYLIKGIDPILIQKAKLLIKQCNSGMELVQKPVKVKFEHLGEEVNSIYDDYAPFIPVNESFLVFSSRQDQGEIYRKESGVPHSSVYYSKTVDGEYSKAVEIIGLNSKDIDEEIVGLTANGDQFIIYKESNSIVGDLYEAKYNEDDNSVWSMSKLDESINSAYTEIAASITGDGSKIFFASDREGGYGGVDIYMAQRLPNGNWSEPVNLGPDVNTEYDEDYPNVSPDGKKLNFSSKGHNSMGGYDIFTASLNEETNMYGEVQNIGFPINTTWDDRNFRLSETGRYGYIAAVRAEGLGKKDIYRVTFEAVQPKYTVIRGVVKTDDGSTPDKVYITAYDENGDVFGEYSPNPKTFKYAIILPAGNYDLSYEAKGYQVAEEKIRIKDKNAFIPEWVRDINLIKE